MASQQPLSPWRQRMEDERKQEDHRDRILAKRSDAARSEANFRGPDITEAAESRKVSFGTAFGRELQRTLRVCGLRLVSRTQSMLALISMFMVLVAWWMHLGTSFKPLGLLGERICVHFRQYLMEQPAISQMSCSRMPNDSLKITLILAASSAAVIVLGVSAIVLVITLANYFYELCCRRSTPGTMHVPDLSLQPSAAIAEAAATTSPRFGSVRREPYFEVKPPEQQDAYRTGLSPSRATTTPTADKDTNLNYDNEPSYRGEGGEVDNEVVSVDGEVVDDSDRTHTDNECASTTSDDDEDKDDRVTPSDRRKNQEAKHSEEKHPSDGFSYLQPQQPLQSPTSTSSPYQSSGRVQSPSFSDTMRSKPSPSLPGSYASPQHPKTVAAQLIASARSSVALSPNLTVVHRASPGPHSNKMQTPTPGQSSAAPSGMAQSSPLAPNTVISPDKEVSLKAALIEFEEQCLGGEEEGGEGVGSNGNDGHSVSSPMHVRSPQAVAAAEAWAAQQKISEAVEEEVHLREISEAEAAAEEARRQKAEAEEKAAAEAAARAKAEGDKREQQQLQEARQKQAAEAEEKRKQGQAVAQQAAAQQAATQQQRQAAQAQRKAAAALQAAKDPFVEAWRAAKTAAEKVSRTWKVKLNARKNDTNPSTIAVDIVTRAASLVAPVPPPVDKHLDFFIVNEVVSKVGDLKLASADDFAKYALLLLQCGTVRPNLVPLALGAVADALSPDQNSSSSATSSQGCLLAPLRPSIPSTALRLRTDAQSYKELSALSACLMEPLASMLLDALHGEINQQRGRLPQMPPLPAPGTPAATPVVPEPNTSVQNSGAAAASAGGGSSNRTANALRWLTKAVAVLEREISSAAASVQVPTLVEKMLEPFLRVSSCALWRSYGEAFEKEVAALRTRVLRPLASSSSATAATIASLSHRLDAFLSRAMESPLPPMRGGAGIAPRGVVACPVPVLLNFSDDAGADIRKQKWDWLAPNLMTSLQLGNRVAEDLGPTPR